MNNNIYIIVIALLGIHVYCQENITPNQKPPTTITNNTQATIKQDLPSTHPLITQHTQNLTKQKGNWQKDINQHHNNACIRRINKLYTQVR